MNSKVMIQTVIVFFIQFNITQSYNLLSGRKLQQLQSQQNQIAPQSANQLRAQLGQNGNLQEQAELAKQRQQRQLQDALQEQRAKKDPNYVPTGPTLEEEEKMQELYNLFISVVPENDDLRKLTPQQLYELYQQYMESEVKPNNSYEAYTKKAADYFGFKDISKKLEKEVIAQEEQQYVSLLDEQPSAAIEEEVQDEGYVSLIPTN